MRRTVSTVGVVTAQTPDGVRGMTLTAFMSMSMDPPIVAFAVNTSASLHEDLAVGRRVSLNLLSPQDEAVARAFGGEAPANLRMKVGDWSFELGAPALQSASASIVADITSVARHGSHSLFVAAVTQVGLGLDETVLMYGQGRYQNSTVEFERA